MKKLIFALLLSIFIIPNVNAETYTHDFDLSYFKTDEFNNNITKLYSILETKKNDYKYYIIYSVPPNHQTTLSSYYLLLFNNLNISIETTTSYTYTYIKNYYEYTFVSTDLNTIHETDHTNDSLSRFVPVYSNANGYTLYDTNLKIEVNNIDLEFTGIYNEPIRIKQGDYFPIIRGLLNNDSWDDYIKNEIYKEVNLNNYEYIILNLKNYNKKETFETNLKVKGSIGITPVYEFGTTEKDNITDLCNTSYSEYTDYRFFILKNDLINNAVYIIKECKESGSSFMFDSTIFDITYVTTENVDDPVITFGGIDYHTIPFNKLTNTVNKNEVEGFIPGENGSSLSDVINNITEYITSFWSSLTTFMSLVVKFFNTLPIEIRAISITTFTTACTLGLLKILKS